jgi:hypothetical protein
VRTDDARGLQACLAVEPKARFGVVFYTGDDILPLARNVLAAPCSALLS